MTRQSPGPTPAELAEHARKNALEQIEALNERLDREAAARRAQQRQQT